MSLTHLWSVVRKVECCGCGGTKELRSASHCYSCSAAYRRELRARGGLKDRRRNHRTGSGDVVCSCDAYKHPHRMFSRKCKPQRWVEGFFDISRSDCTDCLNLDGHECQVVLQVEQTFHCPALRDYIRYEGIALYGAARRQFERSQGGM